MHRKIVKNGTVAFRISGLSNDIHFFEFAADPGDLDLTEQFREKISVTVEVDKSAHQIYVKAKARTAGLFQCDRCLEEFRHPFDADYGICYVYSEKDGGKFPPEELQVISPDTVAIDITEEIRQLLIFSIPLKLLCGENCLGLCRRCGANRNRIECACVETETDPRWHGLKDLLQK